MESSNINIFINLCNVPKVEQAVIFGLILQAKLSFLVLNCKQGLTGFDSGSTPFLAKI